MNLKSLYKVETLDTRFHPASPTPLPDSKPSKWRTWEYYFYYFVFITVVPMMFKTMMDMSQPEHAAYAAYLSPGWIPGRKVVRSSILLERFTC